jgi:hypothetical protein
MTLYFARVRLRVLERMVNWFAAKKATDRFLIGTPIRTRPTVAGL